MLSNVYVFTGNPFLVHYLKKEWVRKFREKYGTEGISTYELNDGAETERLLQELTMQSFFVSKRLLVANGNPFSGGMKKGRKKKAAEPPGISPLLEALEGADDETIVVLTEEGSGNTWPEAIPAANIRGLSAYAGKVVGYDPKKSMSYAGFFTRIFGETIRREALLQIVSAVQDGTGKDEEADLFAAFHALEQIALLPSETQTREHALQFLHTIPEERGYDLVSTLLSGKTKEALGMLDGLLSQGMHPRQIFRMVSTQTLDLVKAKAFQQDSPSLSEAGLAEKLGKTPWQAGKIATTAKKTDIVWILGLQEGLIAMNVAMNSGDIDAEREEDFRSAFAVLTLRSGAGRGSIGSSSRSPTASGRKAGQPSTIPA